MSEIINIPKGTKDVLPSESYRWQWVELAAREVCLLYNYREIRTPVFEHTPLFLRSIGADTDVVGKEMYTFLDKGGRSVTLKPEGTAPVARSFVENNLESESLPLKLYYFTPVFRYERPQAGRLREHHQFGVEVYGGDNAYFDYEVIELAYKLLKTLTSPAFGAKLQDGDLALHLNSIGCPVCRKAYHEKLKAFLRERLDDLCPTCRERYEKNPLRVIDCKVEACKALVADAPKIYDHICPDCRAHMDKLTEILDKSGIPYRIDKNIVRGLDYYTKTVFEFVTTKLGAQGTVCGGGRYNGLVESIGGKPTPCVGFGMGIERLLLLLDAAGVETPVFCPVVFVASQSPAYIEYCRELCGELRNGLTVETDYMGRSLKAQLKYADKRKASYVVIVGENEVKSGELTLKDMTAGTSAAVKREQVGDYIRKDWQGQINRYHQFIERSKKTDDGIFG